MSITLRWLIENSRLKNLRCLTNPQYLDNEFESVNILDNPDVLKWIKRNELTLTTGYIFKNDPQLQITILHELKEIGCAALCIKIKRFFHEIPPAMIAEADKIGLPIIELPFFYAFSDINSVIYNELYHQASAATNELNLLTSNICSLFWEQHTLSTLLQPIADYLQRTVFIVDVNYSLLAIALPLKNNFTSMHTAELFDISDITTVAVHNNITVKHLLLNGQPANFTALDFPAFLGVFFIEGTQLSEQELQFLHNIMNLLSIKLGKQPILPAKLQNQHNFFFDYLLAHDDKPAKETCELLDFYGFNYTSSRVCVIFSLADSPDKLHSQKIINLLKQYIGLHYSYNDAFICSNEQFVVVFFFINQTIPLSLHIIHDVEEFTGECLAELSTRLSFQPATGISLCHQNLETIKLSFQEALDAMTLGKSFYPEQLFYSYSRQTFLHTLNRLDNTELRQLCETNLLPLITAETATENDLLIILQTYYETNFNASKTAQQLFIHRNTLLHKLDKIKALLDCDLSDFGERTAIYQGLCAYNLLKHVRKHLSAE